ncbi:MAG: hypothetical protein RDU25_04145 [Patescibacteria group bacterium]|nr:hypothetical protein [Patescibacteria group bacterium]
MRNKFGLTALSAVLVLSATLGAGCFSGKDKVPDQKPAGPKPLEITDLSPQDAAKKIVLTAGSVIKSRQFMKGNRSGAKELGYDTEEIDRNIVIKRFAPGNLVDLEWKAEAIDADKKKIQRTGSLPAGNLKNSYQLMPPAFWKEGDDNALGKGVLWLSPDVYENLLISKQSSLDFGLTDATLIERLPSGSVKSGLTALSNEVERIIDRQDVFFAKADSGFGEYQLVVNGVPTKVEVIKAHNWFGEVTVLNNRQNPLVLKLKLAKNSQAGDFGGLFDYEIVELKDLQE